jgi:hypothetical protein
MRYHRAPLISGPEAAFLLEQNNAVLGHAVAVSCDGQWYDVRALSGKELQDFTDDLARKRLADMSVMN